MEVKAGPTGFMAVTEWLRQHNVGRFLETTEARSCTCCTRCAVAATAVPTASRSRPKARPCLEPDIMPTKTFERARLAKQGPQKKISSKRA